MGKCMERNMEKMNLYEIDARIESLIDPETGELMDFEAFDALQIERERKIEGMCLWYKNILAESGAVKEEADTLRERHLRLKKKADALKEYIGKALNGEPFSTPRCTVSFRLTHALDISDVDGLVQWAEGNGYDDCLRYKAPEIDKNAVRQLIKSGVSVPYASVVDRKTVGVK